MSQAGKTVIITGAGNGIGKALAQRYDASGANLVLADRDAAAAQSVASICKNAIAQSCDVRDENQIIALIDVARTTHGPPDIVVSNAGVVRGEPSHAASADNATWDELWQVHVMAHVYIARAVLPEMIARGHGQLVQMASAAGLLNQIGDAAYTATKHAAVAFAESLAVTHGDDGIDVRVVCPQYVATAMTGYADDDAPASANTISVDGAADAIMAGLAGNAFVIHTHPNTAKFAKLRASDPDIYLEGMRKLRRKIIAEAGSTKLQDMHKWV